LPARCGGRLVFGALLAVLVVALALRVWSAARGYDFRNGSDADLYERIAAHLHEKGTFELPGSSNPYDFAPGVPYVAAAVYALAGQVTPLTARIVMAVLSTLVVVVVFLIGRRLAGPWAGLVGAALTAVYPPAIFYAGLLMGEPLAMLTVASAMLAFLWAADDRRSPWAWALPGALFGLTAYLRPEYLFLTLLFAVLAVLVITRRRNAWRGLAAGGLLVLAFAVVIAPWTIHVSNKTGQFTPVSTGGGKALFIGTYLPGNGLHEGVKRSLYHRFRGGGTLTPEQLRATPMNPLLDEVAKRYPDLSRDNALQRVGRRDLVKWSTGEPRAFADMMVGKIRHMWRGSGDPSDSLAGGAFHYLVLALGLIGLLLLALRRRWEALPLGLLIVGISVLGGLLLAGTRRNVPVMPVLLALAGVTVLGAVRRVRARAPDRAGPGDDSRTERTRREAHPVPQ
jgi:4-amino-4-deoxy-L-arabinose transferase-like glycosyltransferase